MSTYVGVPEDVEKALIALLQKRYPELEASAEIERSISYARSNSSSSIYDASVTYFHENNSSTALFEFSEHADKHGPVRRWYCRHDWND